MRILLTGTHFTTAAATIPELQKFHDVKLVYVGRKTTKEGDSTPSVESIELPKLGVKFIPITTGRLQRSFTLYTIPSLLKIPVGFIQALFIILKEKPDVVLSFGGYVGVPIVFWAWLFSIPVIIHEQTLVSGLANTISSWFADKIAVSFESDDSFNGEKVILTGNPIRQEILDAKVVRRRSLLPTILITGGTDRQLNYKVWARAVKRKIKPDNLVLLEGSATRKMGQELRVKNYELRTKKTLSECVHDALKMAGQYPKSVILFSPAAKSFEKFKNEFDRGRQFNKLIRGNNKLK